MKKAALVFLALTLLMLFAAAPATAGPTDGQKVAVTLKFTPVSGSSIPGDRWVTNGGVTQVRDSGVTYAIELNIDGSILSGQSVAERDPVLGKRPEMVIYHEYHIMSFPTAVGGFEGNALLKLTDFVSATVYTVQAHGVFQGTGAFEGQTLNLWRYEGLAGGVWEGYLLKP
jgi:hypothetical protein